MYEMEFKGRVRNRYDLERRLIRAGCSLGVPVGHVDRVFLPVGSGVDDLLEATLLVRVRELEDATTLLTLKRQAVKPTEWLEYETGVSNYEATLRILSELGFEELMQIKKTRRTCSYGDFTVCLDEVAGLGSFLELEILADSTEKNSERRAKALNLLEELGIEEQDHVAVGYHVLMARRLRESAADEREST